MLVNINETLDIILILLIKMLEFHIWILKCRDLRIFSRVNFYILENVLV